MRRLFGILFLGIIACVLVPRAASQTSGAGNPQAKCTDALLNTYYVDTANNQSWICNSTGWRSGVGLGTPASESLSCAAKNYGNAYTDLTNNNSYFCTTSGWVQVAGGAAVPASVAAPNVLNTNALGQFTFASSPQIIQSGLLAEYNMTECTGTTIADSSGNGNNGTFGVSAPSWVGGAGCSSGGVSFNGGAGNFITLPAALNAARTIYLVTDFFGGTHTTYQSPLSGNATTGSNYGAFFTNLPAGSGVQTSGGGLYNIGAWANNPGLMSTQSAAGVNLITWQIGLSTDSPSTSQKIWVNSNIASTLPLQPPNVANSGGTGGYGSLPQSAGNYQLGGSDSGKLLASFPSWYYGNILYAAFYSTYQTPAQLSYNYSAIVQKLAGRGLALTHQHTGNGNNQFVGVGDSETYGTGTATNYLQYMVGLNTSIGAWQWVDVGLPSATALEQAGDRYANVTDSWFESGGANNVAVMWLGTNDCGTGATAYNNFMNAGRSQRAFFSSQKYKLLAATMMSRTGQDTCKNVLNTSLRQTWNTAFDGLVDVAADPLLGADNAFATTPYPFLADGIHVATVAQADNIAPIMQRAVNRTFACQDFSCATTYTIAATAAVATTAGSESTNTITVTFGATPANCQAGNTITIAGTTPAGYSGNWQILTRSATQITALVPTASMGVITVQGTGVCPQQQDVDKYFILGGSAVTPNFTLETCVGYTGQNLYIKHSNTTSPWTVTPWASETIDGAASLTMPVAASGNYPVVILQSQLVSSAAGGCNWVRLQ